MRLTRLKLAGFKSFVDPTSVELPGQLVGVVGPNGCGKSNIMDAVRWVLGESRASELRGESMQDVIFNGSTHRNPVSRASVELVFDNAQGRAPGQWSQYAELAVKRVLARSGQSDYFINHLKVRRKDITDLFLGTGLGPRAYAIIGQGMISRIIEARPDDLRVFLEEAAGVTRYRERRRETGGRLEDSRENLLRVEDIRAELAARTEQLEAQAEIARRYHDHTSALARKQQALWILRRNDARAERERLSLEIARTVTELEGATATLRETENRLETAREAHFAAGDAVHRTQGEFFTANAEVARLETEIRHRREARRQLEARLAQLSGEEAHWRERTEELAQDSARWTDLAAFAARRVGEAEARRELQSGRVPDAEEIRDTARAAVDAARRETGAAEQCLQVERAHQAHARRNLETLAQRRARLERESATWSGDAPHAAELENRQETQVLLETRLADLNARLAATEQRLPEAEAAHRAGGEALQQAARDAVVLETRLKTLEQTQAGATGSGDLAAWREKYGLPDTPLWRQLVVEPGWETAVEAVLRERLNALPASAEILARAEQWTADRPGQKVSLVFADPEAQETDVPAGSLLGKVRADARWMPLLSDWLAGARVAACLADALRERAALPSGVVFVTPRGDIVGRHDLSLFAPDKTGETHGLLERQREIETLERALADQRRQAEIARTGQAAREEDLQRLRETAQALRREQQAAQREAHAAQVETLKYAQALERHREQSAWAREQMDNLDLEAEAERERACAAEEAIAGYLARVETLRAREQEARASLEAAERALREEQERAAAIERELREAEFSLRECQGKLEENAAGLALAEQQSQRIATDLAACRAQAEETPPEAFEEQLRQALETRGAREIALAEKRDALEAAAQELRGQEETRMRVEQGLEPLRTAIGDLKLREQAAALGVGQLDEQLREAGADEAALAAMLAEEANPRPQALAQEIGRLQKAIADLGAVNLAALEELETARARKGYLDEQAADLMEAMETLEAAIRRIDRETRDLLQSTFDTVNTHFGHLFPELFGGGRAALVMTGEEILDAGVQVFAQPPGKKNTTIHLLSGGEKALTAIALVFSMFQLNPAPFCLLDEVDAPLDDTNTERFCRMVKKMSGQTQFLFISHNKIAMEMAGQLVGVTMQESGVSRVVEVDMETALKMSDTPSGSSA
ncbi:MAG: chromosome segregation protein SMC [Zoogloeaceae bacterium]|nr:chromosome segregation protein SMC [Zoogloeaceae bacterium]